MIFCTYCGHENSENNKYCESCGKLLVTIGNGNEKKKKPGWMRKLPAFGGAFGLWFFFLPWILVSCGGNLMGEAGIEATGYEIASGNYSSLSAFNQFDDFYGLGDFYGNESADIGIADPMPALWLIFLFAAFGLFALNGRPSGAFIATVAGILGLLGMAIFTIMAQSLQREISLGGVFVMQFRSGYWGTWIAFAVQTFMGFATRGK